MVFLLGNVYTLMDSSVTYKMHPKYNGISMFWIRLFIGTFGITAFAVTVIGASVANKNSIFSSKKQRLHWGPDDPGYAAHLVSTFGEWFMGLAFISYFFTYIRDFGKFSADLHINMKVGHLDQVPLSDSDDQKSGIEQLTDSQRSVPNESTSLLT